MPSSDSLNVIFWVLIGWTVLLNIIAWASGWRELARRFPDSPMPDEKHFRFQSGSMRLANYSFCLGMRVSSMGIRFSIFPLLRPGHPPFRLPWHEITIEKILPTPIGPYLKVRIGNPSWMWMALSQKVVEAGAQYLRAEERMKLEQR